MKTLASFLFLFCFCTITSQAKERVYTIAQFGLTINTTKNASPIVEKAITKIKAASKKGDKMILRFAAGVYHFYPKDAAVKTYYISNHDQVKTRRVGVALEELDNFTLDGQGAQFIFHGRMLPLSLVHSTHTILTNFSVDFAHPLISQVSILENKGTKGILFQPAPWVNYRITPDSIFEAYGQGWSNRPNTGIAFEKETKHVAYHTSDLSCRTKGSYLLPDGSIRAPRWNDKRLIPGTVVAMRGYERPNPALFLSSNDYTTVTNVQIHYAEGMGLLAQICKDITLDHFSVSLKGQTDPRYFTTQADATHFSGCKGRIISKNGLYEGMMDDAINVHGTYLKVIKRVDSSTLIGRYMHDQSWGFSWGMVGDSVQFLQSRTMDLVGAKNSIRSIKPYDQAITKGAREFIITFQDTLLSSICEQTSVGIENLTWTPEVLFSNNVIRNNRARGSLFSTPKKVVVEHNLFDHTSGSAILLCGDCNGWFETGACRSVLIRKNRFVNALTNMFQFTNAIISIYPEIPDLAHQTGYFHGGKAGSIVIEENEFDTFDIPILYAKSVDGLIFRNNKIKKNNDYKPFHWNKSRFLLERVTNLQLEE